MVERGVEHADDLTALIVDDRLGLLVPEGRDRETPFILRIRFVVQLTQACKAV